VKLGVLLRVRVGMLLLRGEKGMLAHTGYARRQQIHIDVRGRLEAQVWRVGLIIVRGAVPLLQLRDDTLGLGFLRVEETLLQLLRVHCTRSGGRVHLQPADSDADAGTERPVRSAVHSMRVASRVLTMVMHGQRVELRGSVVAMTVVQGVVLLLVLRQRMGMRVGVVLLEGGVQSRVSMPHGRVDPRERSQGIEGEEGARDAMAVVRPAGDETTAGEQRHARLHPAHAHADASKAGETAVRTPAARGSEVGQYHAGMG